MQSECVVCETIVEEKNEAFTCPNCQASWPVPVWRKGNLYKVKTPVLERALVIFLHSLPWSLTIFLALILVWIFMKPVPLLGM